MCWFTVSVRDFIQFAMAEEVETGQVAAVQPDDGTRPTNRRTNCSSSGVRDLLLQPNLFKFKLALQPIEVLRWLPPTSQCLQREHRLVLTK
jgi:hypothetical protein